MCSIIGRFTSGNIGFGVFEVSGRRRVPSPPAIITAFTIGTSFENLAGGNSSSFGLG
ncbi:unannotated protein [freshwater metagenome]|uniref:Unannotated protein n=1 Tax=freshwater metagenome TaxID=449393 RepID=A0A6J7SKK1_9ZZZZ